MARRVLIADGNADAADSLAELLRLCGHVAEVVRTGPDAVAAAAGFAPDVAFLALALPGLDGCGVARALAAAGRRPRVLVALTGYGSEAERRAVTDAGFDHHLLKPADPQALLRLLDAA